MPSIQHEGLVELVRQHPPLGVELLRHVGIFALPAEVTAGPILDCWQYHIREGRDVVIVTYGCPVTSTAAPAVSSEHKRAGLFTLAEVPALRMPAGYKRSTADWFARLGSAAEHVP